MSEDIPDDVQARFQASQTTEAPEDVQARFAASQQSGPYIPQSGPSQTAGIPANYGPAPNPNADNETGILHAFGQGFHETADAAADNPYGLSEESVAALRKAGYFAGPDSSKLAEPFQGFFEAITRPAAAALDSAWRGSQGIFRGLQSAGLEAGLPRDIVALPEAFAGSPGALERPRPSVVPAPIRPITYGPEKISGAAFLHEGKIYSGPSHVMALDDARNAGVAGDQVILGVQNGTTKEGFVTSSGRFVDRKEAASIADAADQWRKTGFKLSEEDVKFAKEKGITNEALEPLPGKPPPSPVALTRSAAAKTGIPEVDAVLQSPTTQAVIDNAVIDRSHTVPYMAGGSEPLEDPTVYIDKHVPKEQTAPSASGGPPITFDPAEPWTVHENVEQHTMELLIKGGMTNEEAYRVAHFEFAEPAEQAWYRAHDIDQVTAEKEQQTWLPRIQHEDANDIPENLYKKPYPHADVKGAQQESIEEARPSPEEVARAKDIIRNAKSLQPPDVVGDMQQARDLGVIGPEKPPITEGAPAEAAKNAVPPRVPPGAPEPKEPPPERSPWRQRFDQFVGKLKTGDDVKALIQHSADEEQEFPAARRGDIPLAQAEGLSQATGIPTADLDLRGIGRLLKNDNEVRAAMRLMLKTGDDLHMAMQEVAAKGGKDDLAELTALQEARMRHSLAVEQIAGLRAEWGRTGNVFQEFQEASKEAQTLGKFLADKKGETVDDLRDLARQGAGLDPRTELPRFMNDRRTTPLDRIYWVWVQGLISGVITHTKYLAANETYALMNRGVVTPMAALIGKAKQLAGVGDEADRVFFGETAAGLYGHIAAVPTAFMAAARSVRSGLRTPLASETAVREAMIARGETVPKQLELSVQRGEIPQERPIPGVWGRILGAPGDVAGGIHTFFKVLGERSSIEAQAYRQAARDGLQPGADPFWQRRSYLAANPTEAMQTKAIEEAYKDTFMGELGPRGKAWQRFVKETPGLRWLFPFAHIPINLMKATYEMTPAAFLDSEMRDNLMGRNGGAAQDTAVAKMVVGSSVMGYFVQKYMNGEATGEYPDDPKERDAWKLAGKEPNSILIGDHWWSYNRFGPAGDLAQVGANIGRVIETLQGGQDDVVTKATWRTAEAAAHIMSDEVGFQSLENLFEAMHDEKKATAFVASEASSFIPFSSMVSQTASIADPYMRNVKTLWDGLKYRVPGARETLAPKRGWDGQPVENPQYGSVIRARTAITDPVDQELARLQIHAAPPPDRIGGVKLPPQLYDQYQATAGPFARAALERLVANPNWPNMPPYLRAQAMRETITATRKKAQAAMMMAHPELIQAGVQAKVNRLLSQPAPQLQQ